MKSPINIIIIACIVLAGVYWYSLASHGYDRCILDHVPDVKNNYALGLVKESCKNIYK